MEAFCKNEAELLIAFGFLAWLLSQVRVIWLQVKVHATLNPFFVAEVVPLAVLACFYALLSSDWPSLASDDALRLAIFRPWLMALVFLQTCYLLNGKINMLQSRVIRWIRKPSKQ